MFVTPTDVFGWADALANFKELFWVSFLWVVSDSGRRVRALALDIACESVDTIIWVAPSLIIMCGLLVPVGVAVAYTDQPLNQAIIAACAIPLCWLWYCLSRLLDSADGYLRAAVAVSLSIVIFGYIAYMPFI